MKTKNYNLELKSRSHYYNLESRIRYSCQRASTIKEYLKEFRAPSYILEEIDSLSLTNYATSLFNIGSECVRVVYNGE